MQHLQGHLARGNDHLIRMASPDQDVLRQVSPAPDLILLDIKAAGARIFEVMEWLCELDAPVVAHTSRSSNGVPMRDQAVVIGCTGYIPKPPPEDLCNELDAYLNGRCDRALTPEARHLALWALGQSAVSHLVSENTRLHERLVECEHWFHTTVHELRSNMAWVAVYATMLPGRERYNEALEPEREFRRALEALQRCVEDLQDFSESETGELSLQTEALDLDALVWDYVERHSMLCNECKLQMSLAPVTVEADPHRLMQVLNNLVGNAHKFTRSIGAEPKIEVRVARRGGQAILEVLDNGAGVPDGQKEAIFVPFTRSRAEGTPGMGLGLSLVRRIVQAHRGEVECADNPDGKGSRFIVRLPQSDPRT